MTECCDHSNYRVETDGTMICLYCGEEVTDLWEKELPAD